MPNVYFAGDDVDNPISIATGEAAVVSGLHAAREVAVREEIDAKIEILPVGLRLQLGDAEAYLDLIAEEVRAEAGAFSIDPTPLLALVDQTRILSGR